MAKCYACKNYQSGYCKLTGTHSYTGDICNEFVNKEQSKMFDDSKSELHATKRYLWLARAMRAKEKIAWFRLWNASIGTMNPEDGARKEYECWQWVERKCRE